MPFAEPCDLYTQGVNLRFGAGRNDVQYSLKSCVVNVRFDPEVSGLREMLVVSGLGEVVWCFGHTVSRISLQPKT